ncbi:hypothetical protein [Spirosoma oryzicola]|uniref:hypothetical protein n=1 Tax=Spirosoma oryzicola TaxID=2898794 RepID=UPI001E64909D|nr:hypothetical protein [Spirosoma oryzicola]UHG94633.1 hypothetical protein LQ777_28185 [Spirosoma oryzicola]
MVSLCGQRGYFRRVNRTHSSPILIPGPILCIDDDEDDQYLIGQALQQLALPNLVLFFPHGEAVLADLETTQDRPFLILCDINMPLMNGL